MLEPRDYGRIFVFLVVHSPVTVSFPVCSTSSSPPCFWFRSSSAMSVFGGGVLSSPWLGLFAFSHVQHKGLMSEEAKIGSHTKRKWGFAGWVVAAQIKGGGAAPQEAERNGAHQVESTRQSEGRLWKKESRGKSRFQQSGLERVRMPLVHAGLHPPVASFVKYLWNRRVCIYLSKKVSIWPFVPPKVLAPCQKTSAVAQNMYTKGQRKDILHLEVRKSCKPVLG